MPTTDTMTGTTGTHEPASLDPVRETGAEFPDREHHSPDTLARPSLTVSENQIRLAVTDRGCQEQIEHLTTLLKVKGVTIEIEPVNAENLNEIGAWIQSGKVDGLLLTSWEDQHWQIAQLLDLSLLAQNNTSPVPLLAIAEPMGELLGGINDPYRTSRTHNRLVHFEPGSHLRRWARVGIIRVMPERLHDLIPPSDHRGIAPTATSIYDGKDTIEGFEVMKGGALHVGVRFDPVKLHRRGVLERTAAGTRAAFASRNIIEGFVKTVRDHAKY